MADLAALPDASALAHLRDLLNRGLLLDAYFYAKAFGPLDTWQGTEALVLGGRLAMWWGAETVSNRLHVRAFRRDPQSDAALYYYALTLRHKHGPFEVLALLQRHRGRIEVEPVTQQRRDLQMLAAVELSRFRDFGAAEQISARLEREGAADPWFWVQKSDILRQQDRYEEALQAAREARRLRPWYAAAVHSEAHLLQLMGRDPEALELLQATFARVQAASIGQALVIALDEGGRDREMLQTLDRVEELLPMADWRDHQWLAARRFDAAHRLGDLEAAAGYARGAAENRSKYHEQAVAQLQANGATGTRVHLPVPFIRQHYATCAPATLAALSTYWGRLEDHAAIAAEICYDGTPDHAERNWAERQGWIAREFRVDWDTTRALIDRGCPFALVTVGIGFAHLQACIGYDSRIGTLLIRDPYQRNYGEWLAEEFFRDAHWHGPRGLLLLPPEKAGILAEVVLPEEKLYDQRHRLRRALSVHDRDTAQAALDRLVEEAPSHLLTLRGRHEIALHDGNSRAALEIVREIRAQQPDVVNWQLEEVRLLDVLGLTAEHRAAIQRSGSSRNACTAFRRQYAEDLMAGGASPERAERVLRAALRRTPTDASLLRSYANWLWLSRELRAATRVYRLAACTAEKTESYWGSYFTAARHVGEVEEAVELVRQRFRRWSAHSSEPARTLFTSLEALDRVDEGFACLEEARRARPEDGELLVFFAEAQGRYGRVDRAMELLEAARAASPPVMWLCAAARLAHWRQRHDEALGHWRALVRLDPCNVEFHRELVSVLSICEGRPAVHAHLGTVCGENPQSVRLCQLRVEWLRGESAVEALAANDELLQLDSRHAWALREKAMILLRLNLAEEAREAAAAAIEVEPQAASGWGVKGDVLRALERGEEAREHYRTAIRLSVDADWWFERLLATRTDFEGRKDLLAFVRRELEQQVWLQAPVMTFRAVARNVLTPEELDEALTTLWRARPHHWSVWLALVEHRRERGRIDEALALALEATQRFPLIPRTWIDLAKVQAARNAVSDEISALEKAVQINPRFGEASRLLSSAHERAFDLPSAEHVLRRAIAAEPDDAYNHGWLAAVVWRRGQQDEALSLLEHAVTLQPEYAWAWQKLHEWSGEMKQPNRATDLLHRLAESRPGETQWLIRLVRTRSQVSSTLEENLAVLDRAEKLAPRNFEIHDLRAELLAGAGRHREALDACEPRVYGGKVPYELEGRAAWIRHAMGEREAAIAAMTKVVEGHPDYRWGWALLTEWHWNEKRAKETRRCAERWAWLTPQSAVPIGFLAAAHEHAGRKTDAENALQRALLVDPEYAYGARELLKRRLAARDFDAATSLLRHFQTHFSSGEYLIAKARYAVARNDRASAADCLRETATGRADMRWSLESVAEYLIGAGWGDEMTATLAPLLRDSNTAVEAGKWWARARASRHILSNLLQLARLRPAPAIEAAACHQLCSDLVEARRRWELKLLARLKQRTLRANPRCWGQIGYAFATLALHRPAMRWMRDWRERPVPPEPWMLSNLAVSCYDRGARSQALAVVEYALSLPADHTFNILANWRALEAALASSAVDAKQWHARAAIDAGRPYHRTIHEAGAALIAALDAPAGDNEALASAERRAIEAFTRYPGWERDSALWDLRKRIDRWFARRRRARLAVLRTYLPRIRVASSQPAASGSQAVPFSVIWFGLMLLSVLLRSCGEMTPHGP
jgi:tetratricopeptide (TPR) repeat protein